MTQVSAIMPFMSDDRIQQQIKISQKADAAIESARGELGMTKVEMLSRLCQWFGEQPPMLRKLVLGLIDDELKPTAMQVLIERLTGGEKGGATTPIAEDAAYKAAAATLNRLADEAEKAHRKTKRGG